MRTEADMQQLVDAAWRCFSNAGEGLREFPGFIQRIIELRAWERRKRGSRIIELPSLRDLIERKPVEGWGVSVGQIEAILKGSPVLNKFQDEVGVELKPHGGDRRSEQKEGEQPDAVRLKEDYGNASQYWRSRIKRDSPGDYERIVNGEASVMDIRRERGWTPKGKRVTLTGDWQKDKPKLAAVFGEGYFSSSK